MHKPAQVELQLDRPQLPYSETLGPTTAGGSPARYRRRQPNPIRKGPLQWEINESLFCVASLYNVSLTWSGQWIPQAWDSPYVRYMSYIVVYTKCHLLSKGREKCSFRDNKFSLRVKMWLLKKSKVANSCCCTTFHFISLLIHLTM